VAIADLTLAIQTPAGLKANITASALADGVPRTVTLAHSFGNRGAAVSYLKQNEPMLLDRARGWLSEEAARPNYETTRRQLRDEYRVRFGPKLKSLFLTGSRARGDWHADSDWDIIAIVEGVRPCGAIGPLPKALHVPDGNPVDLIVIPPADYDHPGRFLADMRTNHIDL
jgi:predicted nucleotidyltransferase